MNVSIISVPQINGNLIGTSTIPTPPASPPVIHSAAMDGSIYMVGRTAVSNLEGQSNAGGRDAFITKYAPDGTIAWTKMIGTTGDETARAVTTGTDGMIYVTGSTTGNLDGQVMAGSWGDAFISKFTPDGTKLWTKEFGVTNSPDQGRAIATGPDGGIYVAGYINPGSYTTDEVTYGAPYTSATDAFLTKYSPDGSVIWTQQLTSTNLVAANAITVGADGSVFVAGTALGNLDGQVNGGGGGGYGVGDGFVAKYSSDGTKIWTKLTGTSAREAFNGIKVGADGSIYICGSESWSGASVTDASLTKYSPDGTKAWTQYVTGSEWDIAKSLTIGLDGAIYVAGNTNSQLPGHNSYNSDAFVRKFDANGTEIWTQFVWGSGDDIGNALATGVDGSIYMSGVINSKAFLTKFLPDGNEVFTRQLGGGGGNYSGDPTIAFGLTIGADVVPDPPVVPPPVTPNPSSAIDISTAAGASSAIGVIDSTLDSVNSTRSTIGSYINRLSYAADNATNISTNLAASRSTIMDTDYAEESANLAKSQIVQQAATAMLAQANQQPQSVLALLKNL
jgi:flagellin-like hook-associated protein FlgL